VEKSSNSILENPQKETSNAKKEKKPTNPIMKIPNSQTKESLRLSIWEQR